MSDLHTKKCIPCEGGIPGFDLTEIHKYLKMVDGWELKADKDQIYYLIKNFKFKNFLESQNFLCQRLFLLILTFYKSLGVPAKFFFQN